MLLSSGIGLPYAAPRQVDERSPKALVLTEPDPAPLARLAAKLGDFDRDRLGVRREQLSGAEPLLDRPAPDAIDAEGRRTGG